MLTAYVARGDTLARAEIADGEPLPADTIWVDLLRPESLLFPGGLTVSLQPHDGDGAELHLRHHLQAAERRLLERALTRAGGVKRQAARLLGIDERNLGYFLKKHGL